MDCGPARSAARTSFVEGNDAAKRREALNPRIIKDTLAAVAKQKDPRGYAMVRKLKAFAILATGMFIAGVAIAEAQQPEPNAPDLVLVNGKVLTLDDRSTITEAVAVADGKIIATGTSASIKALAGARTRVLDVSGKTVIPGLIDTHAHFKAA